AEPDVGSHDRVLRSSRAVGEAAAGPQPAAKRSREDPALRHPGYALPLPRAVEEMLRFVTPVMPFRRTGVADTELGGQQLQEGDKVVFCHISANRDAKVFT